MAVMRVSTTGKEGEGGETTLKRTLLTVLVAAIMSVGLAGVAYAAGPYDVGGGTWYHSRTLESPVYSHYLHKYRCHTATVWNGRYHPSLRREPGYWAKASASNNWRRTDRSYWNHC